jgi:hypothetical protein
MRILKIFFTSILILLVLGFFGSFAAKQILLSAALRQVKADVKFLSKFSTASDLIRDCLEYGTSFSDEGPLVRTQIRFTSGGNYVLESVCEAEESLRSVIKKKSLPPLVRISKGQSGIIQGQDAQGIELSIFNKFGAIYVDDGITFTTTKNTDDLNIVFNDGPPTVCGGYGYSCCGDGFQTGQDFQQVNALDCPKSCYSSCTEKPVVLSFNSEPAASSDSRIVFLNSADFIEFVYTISDVKGDVFAQENLFSEEQESLGWDDKLLEVLEKYSKKDNQIDMVEKVIINFGDGNSEELVDLRGRTEHTYFCNNRTTCIYNVTLQAITRSGIMSAQGSLSKMQIQVRP